MTDTPTLDELLAAVRTTRRTMRIASYVVPVANVPHKMASDAGQLLCENGYLPDNWQMSTVLGSHVPLFSATYYDGADGRRHFSLRSPEGGADVGQIAKRMAQAFNKEALYALHDAGHGTYLIDCPECAEIDTSQLDYVGGGHTHAAGFDAPLGWEGE